LFVKNIIKLIKLYNQYIILKFDMNLFLLLNFTLFILVNILMRLIEFYNVSLKYCLHVHVKRSCNVKWQAVLCDLEVYLQDKLRDFTKKQQYFVTETFYIKIVEVCLFVNWTYVFISWNRIYFILDFKILNVIISTFSTRKIIKKQPL
jgi:hypothetical protein